MADVRHGKKMKVIGAVVLLESLAIVSVYATGEELLGRWSCTSIDGTPVTNAYVSITLTFHTNGVYRDETEQMKGVTAISERPYKVQGDFIRFGQYTNDAWTIGHGTTITDVHSLAVSTNFHMSDQSRKHALRYVVTNDFLILKDARGSASEYKRQER